MHPSWQEWNRFVPTATFDDPWVDACRSLILVDVQSWPAASRQHVEQPQRFYAPSLDLYVAFHDPQPQAEWLLSDGYAPVAVSGLMGWNGRLWSPDGRLVASGGGQLLCRRVPQAPAPVVVRPTTGRTGGRRCLRCRDADPDLRRIRTWTRHTRPHCPRRTPRLREGLDVRLPRALPRRVGDLARAAERTDRIGLGPGVLVPSLRHPIVNAGAIATLVDLAPGRVAVAIGAGFTGRHVLGQKPMRWADVRAYVLALRGLLRATRWSGRANRSACCTQTASARRGR